MQDVKRVLKRLLLYFLLLLLADIPIPYFSNPYLLTLCSCLILYYSHRVSKKGSLKMLINATVGMELLFILLRSIKYDSLKELDVLTRYFWYLFYVPVLIIPLLLFYTSLAVDQQAQPSVQKKWGWCAWITTIFIFLVLTNDFHQLVFHFQPNFVNWNDQYSYETMYYALTLWQYVLYILSAFFMIKKCRVMRSRKQSWVILIPFTLGIAMLLLLATGNMPMFNGDELFEFPDIILFMVTGVMECCMQLGLIPTNNYYGMLFQKSMIGAQIIDEKGNSVYKSMNAVDLSESQLFLSDGTRIENHTILHKMKLHGGYGLWQDDVAYLDSMNENLEKVKERLSKEAEINRLRNELKERQIMIDQRSHVYDTIAIRTQIQSKKIALLADEALQCSSIECIEKNRIKIVILGAYIKRYANLMLISADENFIEIGEFAMSISEVLRSIKLYGISVEMVNCAKGKVITELILIVFETIEELLEMNLEFLQGVSAYLRNDEKHILCRLTLEDLRVGLEKLEKVAYKGIQTKIVQEDQITYITFILEKVGD
ncbi:MAG: histidine kinase N-terminal 7TM domain-containing protein [Bacillota bacterium]|nr:histidine kinase N-terminal 7TM domain-containing protein [Bacillota bacterium]